MKNKKSIIVILGILFLVFNVIAFVVPIELTSSFWSVYIFSIIAFAVNVYVWLNYLKNQIDLKSKILNIPILYVGSSYLIIQLVVFAVFKGVPTLPTWMAIVVSIMVLSTTLILMISVDDSIEYIEKVEERAKTKVFYIRSLQADVELLAASVSNKELKNQMNKLAEKIKYSDPMSSPILAELEQKVQDKVEELKFADESAARIKIQELMYLIDERNKKCKILK